MYFSKKRFSPGSVTPSYYNMYTYTVWYFLYQVSSKSLKRFRRSCKDKVLFKENAMSWPHCHKTFEYSQENSQLKYLSMTMMKLKIVSTCMYLGLRLYLGLIIFSAHLFSYPDIWVENFLKNTENFYDGGARGPFSLKIIEQGTPYNMHTYTIWSFFVPSFIKIPQNVLQELQRQCIFQRKR
jgi:hypothetical protein